MIKKLKPYIIAVLLTLAVGGLASLLTSSNTDVYNNLNRPALAPPPILFPIVWSVLYILMGIGAGHVYALRNSAPKSVSCGIKLYIIQLVMNFLWTIIFFNTQAFLFAFIWLALLWILIILMIFKFKEVSPAAAYLQIPYILWVTFAGYLNFMIYLLN